MGKYTFYRRLVCVFFALLFVSCAPAISNIPTVMASLSPTGTSGLTPVPSQTALAVPTSTPSLHFYYPKVDKLCPEKREVSLDRLGISNDLKIILSDPNQTGLWRLDIENPSPQLIQKLPLDKWTSIDINPNGKMLAYTIWNPDHSASTRIYDFHSGEQREVLNIEYWEGLAPGVRWLSEQELLIINLPYQSFPLYVANVSTGDSVDVSDVDREPYDEYQTFYTMTGKYYPLYSAGNVGDDYIDFYIYDYSTHQKIQIFRWLQDKIFFYPYGGTNLGLYFYSEKIDFIRNKVFGHSFRGCGR